jgi:hypothetical protein
VFGVFFVLIHDTSIDLHRELYPTLNWETWIYKQIKNYYNYSGNQMASKDDIIQVRSLNIVNFDANKISCAKLI